MYQIIAMEELQNELRELKAQVVLLQKRVDANPFVFTGQYATMNIASLSDVMRYNTVPILINRHMKKLVIQNGERIRFNGNTLYVDKPNPVLTPEFGEMHFDSLTLFNISLSTPNLPCHAKHLDVRFQQEFSIDLFGGLDKFVETETLEIRCYIKIAPTVNNKLFGIFEIKPDGHVISHTQAQIYLNELFAIIKNTKIAKVTVFGNVYHVENGRLIQE